MAASPNELCEALFLAPGPAGLLQVWKFAGPACCCKAMTVASGAGPASKMCRKRFGVPSLMPLLEWWPELARSSLIAQLRHHADSQRFIALDRAAIAITARPDLVNVTTPDGKPLPIAVRKGCRAIAELLIHAGAAFNCGAAEKLLHESAASGNAAAIGLLLLDSHGHPRDEPWASLNARPFKHGGTALDVAKVRGHVECANLLRRAGGRHSLHQAAELALPEIVRAWLQEGSDVDERDSSGSTPLSLAARGERHATRAEDASVASENRRSECLQLLLSFKATVDALPITQETPLMEAVAKGCMSHCTLLLEARADPCVRDRHGRSALDRATDPELMKLLASASVNSRARSMGFADPEVELGQPDFVSCSVERGQHLVQQMQAVQRPGYTQQVQQLHQYEQQLRHPAATHRPRHQLQHIYTHQLYRQPLPLESTLHFSQQQQCQQLQSQWQQFLYRTA